MTFGSSFPFNSDDEKHVIRARKTRKTRNGTQNLWNGRRAQGKYDSLIFLNDMWKHENPIFQLGKKERNK